MSVVGGSDERTQVANVTAGNFANVVAVDTPTATGGVLPGSGYLIGPQHVLTADHVMGGNSNARVTTSGNVAALPSRANPATLPIPPASLNVGNVDSYNSAPLNADMALLTLNSNLTTPAAVLGLLAFVDVNDANGLPIQTAGYPWNITQPLLSVNMDPTGRTMYTASGTVASGSNFSYSQTVDTEGGQSGSGVWLDRGSLSTGSFLGSATADLILGVHTNGVAPTNFLTGNNRGAQITKDIYDEIVDQMEMDAGSPAAAQMSAMQLPENAVVGTDPSSFFFIPLSSGDDTIAGSYRKELIIGRGGDDELIGGGADDRLEGGDGDDQAFFSDIFTNYTFTITDPANPAFEFDHTGGSMADGKDSTKDIEFGVFEFVDADSDGSDDDGNLFFVPLQVDPNDNTKLKDGPDITPEAEILNAGGDTIGTMTVESPAWMLDGDVNYTLTIGSDQEIAFNFVYIIDVSGSMNAFDGGARRIDQAKAAYQALTQSLIDSGIADQSLFGIVPFNSSASLTGPVDASTAISTINGLSAGGGTNFGPALAQAQSFFTSLNNGATNIAYFLSDGQGSGASASLQSVAEVRAFGIGGADLSTLNIIDSDTAVLLSNPADLVTEFNAAAIDPDTIDRIDVKVDGMVVDTIAPGMLVESTLGLSFEGSIDGLEVTRTAVNDITFELVFNDGTPTVSLDYEITTGQDVIAPLLPALANQIEVAPLSIEVEPLADETVLVVFTVTQTEYIGSADNEEIIGNDLDNLIDGGGGDNTIRGNGGNDRLILSGGTNLVDGGEGIDTVQINQTQAEAGGVSKIGEIVRIGTDNTLLNVEFIEFSDVRLAVDTLAVTPILTLAPTLPNGNAAIIVPEGNSGSQLVTFTVNLSTVAAEDVVIDFATLPSAAQPGIDFVETAGQLIIPVGDLSGEISVEILGDTDIEADEAVFIGLTAVSGGTFADAATTALAGINILSDDSIISFSLIAEDPTIIEGNPGAPSTFRLPIDRIGGLNGSDTVEVEVVPGGSNPAQESDLVDGFSSRQITFAPGEQTKIVEIPIAADLDVEDDETFGVRLTTVSGSALVPSQDLILTIIDDDFQDIQGTPARDILTGTDGNDIITGLRGADILTGNGGINIFVYEKFQDRGDIITDFSGRDSIDLSLIFNSPNYGSATPFDDYVQLIQEGADTQVQINPVGDSRNIFRSLVTLENVIAADLSASNFIL